MTAPMLTMLSPPDVADLMGVAAETVIGWIKSGELRAVNVGRRGAKRPRYRIDHTDLELFKSGRLVIPPPKPERPRRPKSDGVTEYF